MTKPVAIAAIIVGPLFAFMMWRAGLAFKRGQFIRGMIWATGAFVECVAIVGLLDRLTVRW